MIVYFASDHTGVELKRILISFVGSMGYEVGDCGALEVDSGDDYPDFISIAAKKVSENAEDTRAIVIGASGQGEAMVANRFKGVRAAVYYGPAGTQTAIDGKELDIISSSRDHNNANVLSLGARFLTEDGAKEAVKRWLETSFSNDERHVRRIQKIDHYPA